MDQHALDVLTSRLKALGYRGSSSQILDLIVKAEDNTKERMVLLQRRKYPLFAAFIEHARKRAMVLLATEHNAVRYIRATNDAAVRLTVIEILQEAENALVLRCIFTRDTTMVKARTIHCLAQ